MWLLTFGNSSFKVTFCTDDRSIYKPAVCEDEILVNRPLLFLLPGLEFVFSAGWSSRTLVTDLPAMSPSQGGSPSPIQSLQLESSTTEWGEVFSIRSGCGPSWPSILFKFIGDHLASRFVVWESPLSHSQPSPCIFTWLSPLYLLCAVVAKADRNDH